MIALLQPLSVGNAVRVFLTPPSTALWSRLLRRTTPDFTGPDDDGAVMITDQGTQNIVLDTVGLTNGVPYYYALYSWDGAAFTGAPVASCTPAAIYQPGGPTPQQIVRDRLDLGLQAEVAAKRLSPAGGLVSVITAPFVLADDATFPTVTVHMDSTDPGERFLGENLFGEVELSDGTIGASEGWMARWSITVLGVSLSSDERIALREAIRRVVLANLAVFDDAGMVQIALSQRDVEDTQSYGSTPLYMTYGTFTCLAPTFVTDALPPVIDVEVQPIIVAPNISIPSGPGATLLGAQSVQPSTLAGFR